VKLIRFCSSQYKLDRYQGLEGVTDLPLQQRTMITDHRLVPPQLVSGAAVFLQDACYQHHYIRSRDTSAIVERPERLRAVTIGLAAAIAHLEDALPQASTSGPLEGSKDLVTDNLTAALDRMDLALDPLKSRQLPVSIVQSSASVDLLDHPAVKFVHGDVNGDIYLENLKDWARDSEEKIVKGGSEIPEGLLQGDLYRKSLSSTLSRGEQKLEIS